VKLALKPALYVQFGINPENGAWSDRNESARIAQFRAGQQSYGFPIAKIAARLAVG